MNSFCFQQAGSDITFKVNGETSVFADLRNEDFVQITIPISFRRRDKPLFSLLQITYSKTQRKTLKTSNGVNYIDVRYAYQN